MRLSSIFRFVSTLFFYVFSNILFFAIGVAGIVFALLANRHRKDVYFILGCVATGIYIIHFVYIFKWWATLINSASGAFTALIIVSLLVIPIVFLILSKQKRGFGNNSDPDVTVDFLDSVIQSEDEEIDFEDNFEEDYEISDDDFETL